MKKTLLLALLFAGCGTPEVSNQPAWGMSTYCDHGNRVYYMAGHGVSVVPRDPSCQEVR